MPHRQSLSETTVLSTDASMAEYCRNPNNKCLRMLLLSHFNPGVTIPRNSLLHLCCSVCASSCECGNCDSNLRVPKVKETSTIDCNELQRTISEEQRELVRTAIMQYRSTVVRTDLLTSAALITGLSDQVIENILTCLEYILSADDLQSLYGFDNSIASHVWDVICEIIGY